MPERFSYVMKGGGTVGATAKEIQEGIYGKVIRGELKKKPLAVVCSAPGKDPLNPDRKLTDHAIDSVHASNMGAREEFAQNFGVIYDRFRPIALEVAHMEEAAFEKLMDQYKSSFEKGLSHAGIPEMIMAELLAMAIPGGVYINPAPYLLVDKRGDVQIPQVRQNRARLLAEIGDGIGVVPGFIARSESGQVVTLDRGAGDTSAAYISSLLDATCIIYTDRHGVMSADPKLVESAQTVERLSFREAGEATQGGTYVVHERSLEPLERKNGTMYVRHYKEDPNDPSLQTMIMRTRRSGKDELVKIVTGVPERHIIKVIKYGMNRVEGIVAKIGDVFDENDISISDITSDANSVTVTVPHDKKLRNIGRDLKAAIKGAQVKREGASDQHAAISVVGQNIASRSGAVIEKIGHTLDKKKIRVHAMMMGDDPVAITLYVRGGAYEDAVRALHEKLIEE